LWPIMTTLSIRTVLLLGAFFLFSYPKCDAQENADQWKIFQLGEPALYINLPGEVIPKETALPSDLINRLQRFDTFRFYYENGKLVAVMKFVQFNSPIEESAGTLLDSEVTQIMTSIKAEEVLQKEKNYTLNKCTGRKSTGSFMMENKAYLFQDVLLKKNNSMWQVWVAVEANSPNYEKMMNKIVKEIKF
jgi:hypothetical protein